MLPNEAYERVRSHPPSFLSGFQVRTDSEAIQAVRSTFSNNAPAFEVIPPSPNLKPVLLGHYLEKLWPESDEEWFRGPILVSPLAIRWDPPGRIVKLYDGALHGYNPEHGFGPVHTRGQTPLLEYQWPVWTCEDPVFIVCLSHSFDNLSGEEATRPEDFFDWFTLVAWDRTDGSVPCDQLRVCLIFTLSALSVPE